MKRFARWALIVMTSLFAGISFWETDRVSLLFCFLSLFALISWESYEQNINKEYAPKIIAFEILQNLTVTICFVLLAAFIT